MYSCIFLAYNLYRYMLKFKTVVFNYLKGANLKMRIVLSIIGKDRVGIIALVSQKLAENSINILNINQNILDGYFNMVMMADISSAKISLKELQNLLKEEGEKIGVDIKVQHEDIFTAMHRI